MFYLNKCHSSKDSFLINIFYFLIFSQVRSVRYCNLCSDSSIETHYGGFFVNPRDLQDGFHHNITSCDRTNVALQECEDSCFSLNVTSLHIKSKKLLPFGVSYGCGTMILQQPNVIGCFRKDIVLKTVPPYVVQADYCLCATAECNEVQVSSRHQSRYQPKSDSSFKQKGQPFYGYSDASSSINLAFVLLSFNILCY